MNQTYIEWHNLYFIIIVLHYIIITILYTYY